MIPEIFRQPGFTYAELDRKQREIAKRIAQGGEGAILLAEVEPVITLGRRAKASELLLSPEKLGELGIRIYPTDRGGLATYHGPGQWILFCIERLDRLTGDSWGVRLAVEGLLEIARKSAADHLPEVFIKDGLETGVWTKQGKVASVGVHIEDGILLHGLAINAFRTPTSFVGLKPCGLDASADFLWENPDEAAFAELGQRLIRVTREVFFRTSLGTIDAEIERGYKKSSAILNVGS